MCTKFLHTEKVHLSIISSSKKKEPKSSRRWLTYKTKDVPCTTILFKRNMVVFATSHTFDQFLEMYSLVGKKLNAEKLSRHYLQDKIKQNLPTYRIIEG